MSEAILPARRLLVAAGCGAYATLVALAPSPGAALALAVPLIVLSLCWWTLKQPDRWVGAFFCTALLLPPLPIRMGDSGPHVCLILAALGLVAGLVRPAAWRIPADSLSRAVVLFFFVLLLSVPLAALYSGVPLAAATLARVLLFGISVYVFFYTAYGPGGQNLTRLIFWAGTISALFACVDFYFQFPAPAGFGPQFIWLDTGVYRRAQGVFYEASTLGNLCAFFLTMVAVALTRPKRERPVWFPALLLGGAVFATALVLSYSRASIVNLAVSLSVLILRGSWGRLVRRPAAVLMAIAAGAAASYWIFPAFVRLYWDRLWGSAVYFFSYTEGIFSGRFASWRLLGDFLMEHPLHAILGVGYKTLPYSDVIGRPVVADNMYLSILVETGLVGFAAMLLFHLAILRAAHRAASHARSAFMGTWIFCFWVGQMVQMLSGDLLTYWRVQPLYFWVLAMAIRRLREDSVS